MRSSENALIVLPRLRVQNANCISAPLTWGFPAVTAFAGLMVALERRLGKESGVHFRRFGVVCHGFEPQVTRNKYFTTFNLTRNPLDHDGGTPGIVEEGRAHLELSLTFSVSYDEEKYLDAESEHALAKRVLQEMYSLRIAGGSLLVPTVPLSQRHQPKLVRLADPQWDKRWRQIKLGLLPGYALVMRNDLLTATHKLDESAPSKSRLHEFVRLSGRASNFVLEQEPPETSQDTGSEKAVVGKWEFESRKGWIVPIPIGYAAIGQLEMPGIVANARDRTVPFRFVETIYSMGQWISPHRVQDLDHILWEAERPTEDGLYICRNKFPVPQAA
jgi:CRISPR-associated protein Csy2